MNKFLPIFLSATLLCLTACSDGFDQGTRHPSQHTHNYPDDHNHDHRQPTDIPTRLQEKYQDTNFGSEHSSRWIWQKPNLVIEQLQPLEGKVVADIGAGPYGYFSLRIAHHTPAAKVIAIDIDPKAIQFMEDAKTLLSKDVAQRFETRLVDSNDPKLKPQEADIVLIVNTVIYFGNRVDYFKRLKKGISPGGKLVIIDFKKRNTPVGPAVSERIALGDMEQDLYTAGYHHINSDDRTLEYQYIVTATVDK